jgi:hypothetical protein
MPKVFVFVNGRFGSDVVGCAVAEDGTVLPASHISSNEQWCRSDMGAIRGSKQKHDVYAAHYPDGFEVEWVDDVEGHPVLAGILAKLSATPDEKEVS